MRQEILARRAEAEPRPDSLWRPRTRGCELGILVHAGTDTKAEAIPHDLAQRPLGV